MCLLLRIWYTTPSSCFCIADLIALGNSTSFFFLKFNFNFSGVYVGSFQKIPFLIKNKGKAHAKVTLDLSDHNDFQLHFSLQPGTYLLTCSRCVKLTIWKHDKTIAQSIIHAQGSLFLLTMVNVLPLSVDYDKPQTSFHFCSCRENQDCPDCCGMLWGPLSSS